MSKKEIVSEARAIVVGDTLPVRKWCPICEDTLFSDKFKPRWRQADAKRGIVGAWLISRYCNRCHSRMAASALTGSAYARWLTLRAEMEADVQRALAAYTAKQQELRETWREARETWREARQAARAVNVRCLVPKPSRMTPDPDEPVAFTSPPSKLSPYELASAELEQELGIPEARWTPAQNLECTRRIYRILGWDEQDLESGSAADRMAKAAKKGAEKRMKVTPDNTPDDEEEEG